MVTPCTGVWIEILYYHSTVFYIIVTPCTGVWIEICADEDSDMER